MVPWSPDALRVNNDVAVDRSGVVLWVEDWGDLCTPTKVIVDCITLAGEQRADRLGGFRGTSTVFSFVGDAQLRGGLGGPN